MAFRGSAVAASTGNPQTVTVSGIGILQNDIVLLALVDYTGNTLTWPSGFNPYPVSEVNDGNNGLYVYYKIATASEPTTYSVSGVSFGGALTCRVYSGRNTSSPFTTNSQTNNTSANIPPVTFSITGLTAAANDDVVVFVAQQFSGATTAATLSYSPPSGFANTAIANDTVTTGAQWMVSSDDVAVIAGATGTLAGTLSVTAGAGPGSTRYLAQVISVALASGGGSQGLFQPLSSSLIVPLTAPL